MGTMLQSRGLKPGECPECLNVRDPQAVQAVHQAYLAAGANVIQTNTFGGNRYKLGEYGLADRVREINQAAVRLAKAAAGERSLVAVSMGPTGLLSAPYGIATFDDFYAAFAEQAHAAAEAGADLISLETMSDLQEIRAALIAVKENTRLPVLAQMTFEPNGRTVMGTDPRTAAVVLSTLGADAVGANCSGGPEELLAVLKEMAQVTSRPLVVQPNAGLPKLLDGRTIFEQTPETMAGYALKLLEAGAWIIGGCCGTTPEHIQAISQVLRGKQPVVRDTLGISALTSRSRTVIVGGSSPLFVGERINPTARKKLAEDIREGRMQMVLQEARSQAEAGAPVLDVNMGVPGIDEPAAMQKAVMQIQAAVDVPLVIDSANPQAIEAGLKAFAGKALINSVNGEAKSLQTILPLAKRYGASILGLTLDGRGIPATAAERVSIAQRIVQAAAEHGIAKEDVFIDCLVQTASAQQAQVLETLKGVQLVKQELGVKTVLGVSNVSHGLPAREILNSAFLAMALGFGLDLPIMNPFEQRMREALTAAAVLTNQDEYCGRYIQEFRDFKTSVVPSGGAAVLPAAAADTGVGKKSEAAPAAAVSGTLAPGGEPKPMLGDELQRQVFQAIIDGNRMSITELIKQALDFGLEPLTLVNKAMIPGIEEVGRRYEAQTFFLPQLILGAETMKAGFALLRPLLSSRGEQQAVGKIVLATVQGDIHDIGKNIVAIMLENYGFEVIDLGKDVPTAEILAVAEKENAELIGLSALMTTTMPRMAEVVAEVEKRSLPTKVMIGGAVVTPEYAKKIGAHAYAADARAGVLKALELIGARVGGTH